MRDKISISEAFYSIQGEGPYMGYPAVFLRLGGCNLMCGGQGTQFDKGLHNGATWRCDTIEVWMEATSVPVKESLSADLLSELLADANLVITGGEPLLQMDAIEELIKYLHDQSYTGIIEIETNGTIMPSHYLLTHCHFNCSPKLSNSGNVKAVRYNQFVLASLNDHNSVFKFVVSDEKDFDEILEDFMPIIDQKKMMLMPAGENQDLLSQSKVIVAELCKEWGIRYSSRLHIEIWNKKTGV